MNSYFGLISVYDNGFLPGNEFSRIHGLNFTGVGVSVLTPATSLIGGIGIATIQVQFTDALNVIGGIASVTSLSVSGISSIQSLTGTDAVYSGIVTANKFVGSIEGNITALNVIGGIASVSSLNVSGISTLSSLNVVGIASASTFQGNLNSGVSTITTLNSSTIRAGIVTGNPNANFYGNFTGSLVDEIDLTNAQFIGNIDALIGSVGFLPSTRRIVYVDGNVSRSDLSDVGAASTSGISLNIWTDIWDNARIHGISTSGWNRGTAPVASSTQEIFGSRQVFKTVNQVFTWLNSRSPVNAGDIVLNLYSQSDSNNGFPTNKAADNYYANTGVIRLQRGNSHSRESGKLWGNGEHFTGRFNCPLSRLEFIEANVNCSGTISNSERTSDYGEFCYFAGLVIQNSRFKYYVKNEVSLGIMFSAATSSLNINQFSSGLVNVLYRPYDDIAGAENSNEFIMNMEQTGALTNNLYYPCIFKCGTLLMRSRHKNQANAPKLNVTAALQLNSSNDVFGEFIFAYTSSSIFYLEGIAVSGDSDPSTERYGGLDMNFNLSGSNFERFTFIRNNLIYPNNKSIIVYDYNILNSSYEPINILITPSGSINTYSGLICGSLYQVDAQTRRSPSESQKDIFSTLKAAVPPPSLSRAWIIDSGSVRDGIFSSSQDTF